jgi:hypothetical protein
MRAEQVHFWLLETDSSPSRVLTMAEPDALSAHDRVSGFSSTYLLSLRYPVTFLYIGNVVMHTSHGEDRRDHGYDML